jgi:hypothetical protein
MIDWRDWHELKHTSLIWPIDEGSVIDSREEQSQKHSSFKVVIFEDNWMDVSKLQE